MSNRLDNYLVSQGLIETRSRARDLIKRGKVKVNGQIITKPAANVPEDAQIELIGNDSEYVSRGALKLIGALEHFKVDITDKTALDLGASTGGFCQVLLEKGAAKVYAVDVGRDQLHKRIAENPEIISLEGQDARKITKDQIPDLIDVITSDLSFISLTQALLPALTFASKGAYLFALVKPQFEAGKDGIGKGGIVRDDAIRDAAVQKVRDFINSQTGWNVIDIIPSPITGQSGNQEYLLGAQFNG